MPDVISPVILLLFVVYVTGQITNFSAYNRFEY